MAFCVMSTDVAITVQVGIIYPGIAKCFSKLASCYTSAKMCSIFVLYRYHIIL